eukprot:2273877-Rhodomonas_salina.2
MTVGRGARILVGGDRWSVGSEVHAVSLWVDAAVRCGFRVLASQFTIGNAQPRGAGLTAHGSRFTVHGSRFTVHGSRVEAKSR